jgi:hypothetical protein
MPMKTPNNDRIILARAICPDPSVIVLEDAFTAFTMFQDVSLLIPEEGGLSTGDVIVFDFKGVNLKVVTKLTISLVRSFIKYILVGYPAKINGIHVINSTPLLDKIMMIARPFLPARTLELIHFHQPDSKTLFDFVPKDCLPVEFGGSSGSIDTLKSIWADRVDEKR